LISGGGMSGHVHAQAAQLLYQPPDLGAAGRNFLRDLGAADNDCGVLHKQAHDAAQTLVRGFVAVERRSAFRTPSHTSFGDFADAEIMREAGGKNNARSTLSCLIAYVAKACASETLKTMKKSLLRATVEIAFILFLFYANLLMGEFERSGMGRRRGLAWAIADVATSANFAIGVVAALVGYFVFEFFRKRF
jgi:hypothetical protein